MLRSTIKVKDRYNFLIIGIKRNLQSIVNQNIERNTKIKCSFFDLIEISLSSDESFKKDT